ncbi:MAG: bacteriocin [Bradyrhizobium sp.]|nr:bacteriocin [Bradyrhizobium sp.]
MNRIVTAALVAALLSLGACAISPLPAQPSMTDPVARTMTGAGLGAAGGAAVGALLSLPFPIATIPATALGAVIGAEMGGMTALFTTPEETR